MGRGVRQRGIPWAGESNKEEYHGQGPESDREVYHGQGPECDREVYHRHR